MQWILIKLINFVALSEAPVNNVKGKQTIGYA
jgi:hypothetical protein